MKIKCLICLLFLFIAVSYNAYSLDLPGNLLVTDKGVEGYFNAESNRSERFTWNLCATGDVELNELALCNAGFYLGQSGGVWNFKLFTAAFFFPFSQKYLAPLNFSFKWLYSGLVEYKENIHSLVPMIGYGTDTLGILLGFNFRFSSYFFESSQFELIFTYLLYWNFFKNDTFRFGVKWGTYDDFYARNMGAMALGFDMDIRIDENWIVLNKIEFLQSGQDGFAANFYGFSWKGGVRFSW